MEEVKMEEGEAEEEGGQEDGKQEEGEGEEEKQVFNPEQYDWSIVDQQMNSEAVFWGLHSEVEQETVDLKCEEFIGYLDKIEQKLQNDEETFQFINFIM